MEFGTLRAGAGSGWRAGGGFEWKAAPSTSRWKRRNTEGVSERAPLALDRIQTTYADLALRPRHMSRQKKLMPAHSRTAAATVIHTYS